MFALVSQIFKGVLISSYEKKQKKAVPCFEMIYLRVKSQFGRQWHQHFFFHLLGFFFFFDKKYKAVNKYPVSIKLTYD